MVLNAQHIPCTSVTSVEKPKLFDLLVGVSATYLYTGFILSVLFNQFVKFKMYATKLIAITQRTIS